VRRLLTVLLFSALAGTAIAVVVDAFRSSPPDEAANGDTSKPLPTETRVLEPQLPPATTWEGEHRRTIRMDRRAGASWRETRVLDRGNCKLTLRIDLPRSADVDIAFQSGNFTLGLFGRRVPRDCSRENERDICLSAAEFPQPHSEKWRLVVRKPVGGTSRHTPTGGIHPGSLDAGLIRSDSGARRLAGGRRRPNGEEWRPNPIPPKAGSALRDPSRSVTCLV
jgi:hypothetical protein